MSALRSLRGAQKALRPRDWVMASLVTWILPFGLGLPVIGFNQISMALLTEVLPSELRVASYFLATALFISPGFNWIALVFLLPMAALLAARGWLGWLPALVAGALAGSLASALMGGFGSLLGLTFGAAAGVVLRAALRLRRPELF